MVESSCEGCGAPLPKPDDTGWVTCASCGRSYQVAEPEPEPEPAPAEPAAVTIDLEGLGDLAEAMSSATPSVTVTRSTKGLLGCIPVIVLAVVGISIFVSVKGCASDARDAIKQATKAFKTPSSAISLSGSVVELDGGSAGTDVVLVTQDNEDGTTTRRISRVRFGATGATELWRTAPIGESEYRAEAAAVGTTVFAATGSTLRALDADSGALRWSTKLSDKVTSACPTCFVAVGGKLVVKTDDGYLYAFAPTSSEPVWSRRLNSTQGGVSVVDGRLFLVDDPADASQLTKVLTLDPKTGRTTHRIAPTCPQSDSTPWQLELEPGTPIRAVPGSHDVVAAFGFGDGCIARWDPTGDALSWTLRLDGASSLDQDTVRVGARHLVAAASSALVSVDLATGKGVLLAAPPDAQAVPDRIVGDTLIGDTTTTRGTTKGGLAAWNLADGSLRWSVALPAGAKPVSNSRYHSSDTLIEDESRALLVVSGTTARVWTFEGKERTFSVRTLDLATGDFGTPARRDFVSRYDSGTVSLTIEVVDDQRVLFSVDNLTEAVGVSGTGDIVTFPKGD